MMTISKKILDLSSTWFHGTHSFTTQNIIENGIDLTQSRKRLDFGPGFYMTTNYEQAAKQAARKAGEYNDEQDEKFEDTGKKPEYASGTIMTYDVDLETLSHSNAPCFFEETSKDWALFILGNRTKKPEKFNYFFHNRDKNFDLVYGPLADGFQIPRLISDLEKKKIEMPEFLRQISQYEFPINNQLSIHTEPAVSCLNLKEVAYIEISRPHLNPGR